MIAILSGTFILGSISFTGCNKKVDCDVELEHAHKYISAEGYTTYRISEYETKDKLFRQNEYLKTTDEIKLIDQFNLLKIEDNINSIKKNTSNDKTYIEYEYIHRYSTTTWIGKIPVTTWHNAYYFTSDSNHLNLTEQIRDVDYQYKAYKIITNEEGKAYLQESEFTSDLLLLKNEYPYFKLADYKVKVYSDPYELGRQKTK